MQRKRNQGYSGKFCEASASKSVKTLWRNCSRGNCREKWVQMRAKEGGLKGLYIFVQ
jgi:hypothetical protein